MMFYFGKAGDLPKMTELINKEFGKGKVLVIGISTMDQFDIIDANGVKASEEFAREDVLELIRIRQ